MPGEGEEGIEGMCMIAGEERLVIGRGLYSRLCLPNVGQEYERR